MSDIEEVNISLIVAMTRGGLIGSNGRLPWPRIPLDMRRFKEKTDGKVVIMGRQTFESLPGGPLEGRTNIVVSRVWQAGPRKVMRLPKAAFLPPGEDPTKQVDEVREEAFYVENDLPSALLLAMRHDRAGEIMVIGGAELYAQAMQYATRVYITWIDDVYSGDTFFPRFGPGNWERVERASPMRGLTFETWERGDDQ